MSELPNPVNFEAAARFVREDDIAAQLPCGPDVAKHLEAIRTYEEVGYDHVVLRPITAPIPTASSTSSRAS